MAPKRKQAPAEEPRAEPPIVDAETEYRRLYDALSHKKSYRKEIEASVPGVPSFFVDRALPSFFDAYPRCKRAADQLASTKLLQDAVGLLRSAERVILAADLSGMERHISAVLGAAGGGDDSATAIDIAAGQDSPGMVQPHMWQVDGGDAGWLDFDDITSVRCEESYAAHAGGSGSGGGPRKVQFVGFQGGRYELDFNFMVQHNLASGYCRPVRRVPK
jgi:hypothetical protein